MEAGATKKEPNPAAEGKEGGEDLSMEEILQSIRRIISDDDDPKKSDKPASKKKSDEDVPGSDMLELTDMLKDDGTVVNIKEEPAAPAIKKPVIEEPVSFDILNQIDEALLAEPAPPAIEPVSSEPPAPAPVKPSAMVAPEPVAAPKPQTSVSDMVDSLISEETAQATAQAFARLKSLEADKPAPAVQTTSLPAFRSGSTVEDLIGEMLRPMLKSWLDTNLPQIVQQIVEREVRKLTK